MAEVFLRGTTAHGTLIEQRDGLVILALPGSDYRLHLTCEHPLTPGVGGRVHGVIFAQARRVDVVRSGGAFIEPVYGRPRRIQGRVIAHDRDANTITVNCGPCPITATLLPPQKAGDFADGAFVGFDIEPGATFEPEH
jgi:hypothetical protein